MYYVMFALKNKDGKVKLYLLIGVLLLISSILGIPTLPIRVNLPYPSSHQNGYYDYKGGIHWHTVYSKDALGSYEEFAELGNRYHIDFLISAEHNNLLALKDHKEGWHGRTLTLVGVESTRQEGYLLGLNLRTYPITRHDSTDAFLSETAQQGGFAIIAHLENPRWYWHGKIDQRIVGQEILDLADQFTTASPIAILTGLFYYPFNTTASYMQIYHRPTATLKRWDEETSQRHFIGIYAPDIHQSIRILGRHKFRFPKAEDTLSFAHNHVILRTPFTGDFAQDKSTLYDAIQKGRLYIAIDLLQDATGFFFSARQGDKTAWMGDQLPAGFKTDFSVTLPERLALKNIVINVYRNGQKIARSVGSAYAFQATLPGAYRVEVETDILTFWGLKKSVVWIYSNPIYLR